MKKYFINFAVILSLMLVFSCEDENEVIIEADAKLIWTGEYDVDGCGFFVEIDSVEYKPENEGIIPSEYKTAEPLEITVQYIDLLYEIEYSCGDLPKPSKSKAIELKSMDLN